MDRGAGRRERGGECVRNRNEMVDCRYSKGTGGKTGLWGDIGVGILGVFDSSYGSNARKVQNKKKEKRKPLCVSLSLQSKKTCIAEI